MGEGRKKLNYRMIVAATALTFISSCAATKNSFAAPQKPLFEKQSVALYGEWKKGSCTADPETGTVSYSGNEDAVSFEISKHHFKNAIAIHCSEDKTVLVKEDKVMVINKGANPKKSPFAESFKDEYGAVEDNVVDYDSVENKPAYVNITSTVLDGKVFVLGKQLDENNKTTGFFINKINIEDSKVQTYELGKLFNGNAGIIAYKGIIFIAGEAEKGKDYVFAFKPGENLMIFPFKTKKELKGSVELWIEYSMADSDLPEEKNLVLEIGKKKFSISITESEKKLKDYLDMDNGKKFTKIEIKD